MERWNSGLVVPSNVPDGFADLSFGKVSRSKPLVLVSQMPENGVIFSDGIEADFLQFNSGTEAVITVSNKKGRLAG